MKRRLLKQLTIPPLLPVLLLASLALWVIVDETRSAPRMIDGVPDDGPRNAAGILFLSSPVLYTIFFVLNLVDFVFDRFSCKVAWSVSFGICGLLTLLLSMGLYSPSVDASLTPVVMGSVVVSTVSLLPMTLLRRLVFSSRPQLPTFRAEDAVPFARLFPEAGAAPKIRKAEQAAAGDPVNAPNLK